jgi:hypothetical protein
MLIAWIVIGERPQPLKLGILVAGAMGVALLLVSGRTPVDWLGAAAGTRRSFLARDGRHFDEPVAPGPLRCRFLRGGSSALEEPNRPSLQHLSETIQPL